MIKKLLFFVFIGFFSLQLNSQICGTPSSSTLNITSEMYSTNNRPIAGTNATICLNVFFHIVRNSNGTGGINPNLLTSVMNSLNQYYNPHGIYFVNSGVNFINNTNYLQIDGESEAISLAQTNNNANAINIYIVDSLWSNIIGTALNIPSNRLVIRSDYLLSPVTSHEVGHCLNLLHTHETYYCVEAINGSNCLSCGDQVCDTPADPGLNSNNMSGCTYVGGNGYNPDTTNIMSYAYSFCLDHFTQGQASRIKISIQNSTMLQQLINSNCAIPKIVGADVICDLNTSIVYSLQDGSVISWNTSSNLQYSNPTNSSITVQAIGNQAGWIEATLSNNQIIRKNVWIGKPAFNLTQVYDPDTYGSNGYKESHFFLDNNNIPINIDDQGITQVNWNKLSSSPTSGVYLYANQNQVNGWAKGPNNIWTMNVKVSATNICGTTEHTFIITPPPPPFDPCANYLLVKGGGTDNYLVSAAPEDPPCLTLMEQKMAIYRTVPTYYNRNTSDQYQIKVVNSMGSIVVSKIGNQFDLNGFPAGSYFVNILKDNNVVINQTVIKN